MKKSGFTILAALFLAAILAQNSFSQESKNQKESIVYFTKDISSEGLLKVYSALNQKNEGSTGIKVSFGGPDEQILDASLLKGLVQKTNGTMFDGNGLSGNRWTSALNLALAKANGFTAIGKCVMVSDTDNLDMPVKNGYLLKYARTGKEFAGFDTLISVHRVKLHSIQAFGGNIKNITLCLANRSGKCLIHSGGTDAGRYHGTQPDVLMKSFADAAKAVTDYKKNWAFIDVLDDINPEDGCRNTRNLGKIGIIASSDVVALEQCAVDFLIEKADVDQATKSAWKDYHQTKVIEYAENLGIGTRNYRLVEVK